MTGPDFDIPEMPPTQGEISELLASVHIPVTEENIRKIAEVFMMTPRENMRKIIEAHD